jgi:hypothetical protein
MAGEKAKNPEQALLAFRHLRTRKLMLEVIQVRDGDPDLSATLRRAVDSFIDRELLRRESAETAAA